MLKILVLSDFDSRIKWGLAAALKMTVADQITLVMHRSHKDKVLFYTKQLQSIIYCDPLTYLKQFLVFDYDIVIFAIGGWLNVKAISFLQQAISAGNKRPLLVGGVNGLVDRSDPDVVLSRSGLDVLFLNCKNDYFFFEETFHLLGVESPILIETGYLRKYNPGNSNKLHDNIILFVQQDGVPSSKKAFMYLINKLVEFAASSNNSKLYIKLRNSGSTGVNSAVGHYNAERIVKKIISGQGKARNIQVSSADLESLISICDEVWSISSTALIEGLMQGKKAFCISDFGISKKNGNSPFLGSEIFISLENINTRVSAVNEEWMFGNVPSEIADKALQEFVFDCILELRKRNYVFNQKFYQNSPWLSNVCDTDFFPRIKCGLKKWF